MKVSRLAQAYQLIKQRRRTTTVQGERRNIENGAKCCPDINSHVAISTDYIIFAIRPPVMCIVPRSALQYATMSDDEMNIDEGVYFRFDHALTVELTGKAVAAGGAVRRRGRGFQNATGASLHQVKCVCM